MTSAPITYIYVIGREEGPVKVGITQSLMGRLRSIQTGCPFPLKLLYVMPARDREHAIYHEQNFHAIYEKDRLSGEWFNLAAELAIEGVQTSFQIEEWCENKATFERIAAGANT